MESDSTVWKIERRHFERRPSNLPGNYKLVDETYNVAVNISSAG